MREQIVFELYVEDCLTDELWRSTFWCLFDWIDRVWVDSLAKT